ncbi:tRNA pseudouridine(13) synthase TruD [Bacterioplanoides sp.]|uniref:tRNA pseudouridine(13) synthase TruD n=1 Tax=Bacterioplanoides sp. TaxID=2066072 RepID=UPI003B59391F
MTESALPVWPKLYPETGATGWLKCHNQDFCVVEIPQALPCGEGEHIWLEIEKNGVNTGWIAKQLADLVGVKEMDVGYAGLKDRHAITRQWFSIYLPLVRLPNGEPDFSFIEKNDDGEQIKILQVKRHSKKLRRGELLGNRFEIRLRDISYNDGADKAALERNLELVKQSGVPNYFGEQRFGHNGGNIEASRQMLTGEITVKNRSKKSIYLSAARSLIFNEVVAARIKQQTQSQMLDGDIAAEQQLNGQPIATAPLWGRGRLQTSADVLVLETEVAERYADICEGLEHKGLNQERRALIAAVENLTWQWADSAPEMAASGDPAWQGSSGEDLTLCFSLPSGYYATSVIRELLSPLERTPVWQIDGGPSENSNSQTSNKS